MKKAVFITARINSSRLFAKHTLKINDKHCIEYVIERAKLAQSADLVVMCTTNMPEDDWLADIAAKHGIEVFRGSSEDKINRWYCAARYFGIDFFVSADGDDLFCEPELMDMAFKQYVCSNADLIRWESTNIVCGAFTYGVKVEALEKINNEKSTSDTEMMWHFFDIGNFKTEQLANIPSVFKRPEIRATLDYIEDYDFFKTVIEKTQDSGKNVNSLRDILKIIDENPELVKINQFRHADWKKNQETKIGAIK